MNDGVKLLLERIKTHPEEFVMGSGGLFNSHSRWQLLVSSYEGYLTSEDRDALRKAMNEVMAEKFTEAVMKELMGAEDDNPLGKSQQAQNTVLGGLTQTSPYQQSLAQSQVLMQAQLAQRQALQNSVTTSVSLSSGAFDDRSSWRRFKDWLGV